MVMNSIPESIMQFQKNEDTETVSDTTASNENDNKIKISHKKWRNLIKKQKRKIKRQEEAKKNEEIKEKETTKELSPQSLKKQEIEEYNELVKQQQEKAEKIYRHQLWLERERLAQEAWNKKKEREEKEKQKRLEIEQKIREEWEEQQRKEKDQAEVKEKKKNQQDALLREATANENKDDGPWHNPIINVMPGKERETCPFFAKTGTCRFGERCSRGHPYPESSSILLFPGMYTHFELEQGLSEGYDTDLNLEYEDRELYHNFQEFYNDIVPEFKSVGKVIQVKVCCNYEPHLRGNVYVQYAREEDAAAALAKFNGRYYGGKQLNCEFVIIPKWNSAICGLFGRGQCPKGRNCNFLHVFINPKNEFRDADKDNYHREKHLRHEYDYRDRQSDRYSRNRSSSYRSKRSRSRSNSPRYRRRERHRESSRYRLRSKSRERSKRNRHRSRSTSREKSKRPRSKERRRRDYSRSRSRSYEKNVRYSRSSSRERFRSKLYERKSNSRSYSRSRSRSKSPKQFKRKRSRSHSSENNKAPPIDNNDQNLNREQINNDNVNNNEESASDTEMNNDNHNRSKKHKKHKKHKKLKK